MGIIKRAEISPRVKVSFQGIMRFVKDAELSPLRLWCWLRALSEAPITQEPLPSEFWEAAGEPLLSFTTSVGLVGVPQSQLCNCAGGGTGAK